MKTYELTYIVAPDMTSEEAAAVAKDIEAFVQSKGGTIARYEIPTARTLSYPIKKQASGFFGVIEFQSEPENLKEIEERVKKDGKIVRHMVIIKKPARLFQRRIRTPLVASPVTSSVETETKTAEEPKETEEKAVSKPEKVELKDIEQKLEELLG